MVTLVKPKAGEVRISVMKSAILEGFMTAAPGYII